MPEITKKLPSRRKFFVIMLAGWRILPIFALGSRARQDTAAILKILICKITTIMAKVHGAVEIDSKRCKGCELCVVACPVDVLQLAQKDVNDRGYHYAYTAQPELCIGCAACATVCPDACIEVYRSVERPAKG